MVRLEGETSNSLFETLGRIDIHHIQIMAAARKRKLAK